MKTKRLGIRVLALIGILAALLTAFSVQAAPSPGRGGPGGGGGGGGTSTAPLSDLEKAALNAAIHEEYFARNSYLAVIAEFGDIRPFSNIAGSEQNHVNAVGNLLAKYGLPVPVDTDLPAGAPSWWPTVRDACAHGVWIEKDDIKLYDNLLPDITHGDIIQVFNNLRSASKNNHLPAFQACD